MTTSTQTTLGAILLLATGASTPAGEQPEWVDKVHARVLQQSAPGPTEFTVFLEEQADLAPVADLGTKSERGAKVFEILTEVASRTQAPLIAELEARGLDYRPFWIANMVWVRGELHDVSAIAGRPDVLRLDANPRVRLEEPVTEADTAETRVASAIEWGIQQVGADQLWALGYTGEGVVIGGQDTGYEWSHPALINQYRGWNGVTADHNYNWHDAIHHGGGSCGADSPEPCDDHDHGTHTMGTMVGDDGGSNRIGVSPGARWIGCRNMDQGVGTPASYSECFQWFVAPTDLDGRNPDPSKAPHVINNSWTCPPFEGCSAETLKTVVENTRAAGILVVASAGNGGSGCGTVATPPAIYQASLTVGATDSTDAIAPFSSRGPVTVDGSDRLKPDVTAPGVFVRSSVRGGVYGISNGTSMAGPHVVGMVALLLDARPDLLAREVETITRLSASPEVSTQDCGDATGTEVPNPVYGHGRIDALEAIVGDADGDGVGNLSDCAPTAPDVWASPGPVGELRFTEHETLTTLFWIAPADGGGNSPRYDVLRSTMADDFSTATCLVANTPVPAASESEDPEGISYYLVRSRNACGGNLGSRSDGTSRHGPTCPQSP